MKARADAVKGRPVQTKRGAASRSASASRAPAKARPPWRGKPARIEPASTQARIPSVDALRGLAIVAMIVYHFCFDLRYFGITRWDFEHDLRWLGARAAILSSFLLIAGISAVLANRQPSPVAHWLRHVALIAGAALLVTAGSYLMFPRSFIWFGVLHAIALSLLLAKPLIGRPWVAAPIGAAMIASGAIFSNPVFDDRALGWIGFMTAKPVTEDYVPLFPWMGVLLLGVALGHLLVRTRFAALAPLRRMPAFLRLLGRHSLVVYLVQQPVMIALLWAVVS
jgi:uncharacterized membrane protein